MAEDDRTAFSPGAVKGLKISILSNKPHLLTRKVCEFYLSGWPFEPILGQRQEAMRKPDPAAAFEIATG